MKPTYFWLAYLFKSLKRYRRVTYFTIMELFDGCHRHNFMALNASISFFTLFAMVPLILLIFFFLSQWLTNSNFAFAELEAVTTHLLPQINNKLMREIINFSSSELGWGIFLIIILFLAATPLTASLRSSFIVILGLSKSKKFFKNKFKDIFAVLAIMILFCAYIFINIYLTKATTYLDGYIPVIEVSFLTSLLSFVTMILVITGFFQFYMPIKINKKYLIIGSILTTVCWYFLINAFDFFISMSQSYGLFYGSLRNLFISLIWLFLNTGALLIGAELIAALHKKDLLLLKQIFIIKNIHRHPIIKDLMRIYGNKYKKEKVIFNSGDQDFKLYFVIEGEVTILKDNKSVEIIEAGEYFGEDSLLSKLPKVSKATVSSDWCRIIAANELHIKKILTEDPEVAMRFLNHLAKTVRSL